MINFSDAACNFTQIHKKLGLLNADAVPSVAIRESNFTKLVDVNFNDSERDFEAVNGWPTQKAGIRAYQKLREYAMTPYGGVMIKRIIEDNNRVGVKRFEIRLDNSTARAGTHWISFPSGFPLQDTFPGGEKIDPLAVIHHEFGHTRFFTGNTKPALVSIDDERIAVINNSNPVRMFNKYEPRYTYYNGKETINIITGINKSGRWSFNKSDPREFAAI